VSIKEVAGGYKNGHQAGASRGRPQLRQESEDAIQALSAGTVKRLAVIAYKQPVTTARDHGDPRGAGRRSAEERCWIESCITEAGRKNVIGKPISV